MPGSSDSKVITLCPGCDKRYRVKKEIIGQRIKCNTCGTSFPVKPKEDSKDSKSIIEDQQKTIKQQKELLLQYQKELIDVKKHGKTEDSIDNSSQYSIEGLESMLLRLDLEGNIRYINSTFCKTFKTSSEELINKPIDTLKRLIPSPLFLGLDTPPEQGTYDEIVKDGAGRVYEVRKTLGDEQLDIVLNDITDEEKFKDYVSKYVGSHLVELSDAELQTFRIPERRFMTVSFTDLRGFTAMSETLSPEEVRTTMNSYLEEIIYAINTNQATVDKIVGDEVMALYGAPKYYKDHAFRAIKTACDQIYNLKALQKAFRNIGKSIPDCGIGINSGDMVVGNMGSSTHQDYTVLGAAVNLAARLCGAAMGSQIITTEATLQSVIENLPEGWDSQIIENEITSDSSSMRGKVESIHALPDDLVGKSFLIGPIDETGHAIKPLFKFDYQFLIQAKGLKDLIPVITVSDQRDREERKEEVLSEDTVASSSDRIFGKYRLIELLGRGGMGEVWKARDPFGNIFAVKMLIAGDAASEHQIARFKREAKIMSKLNHRGLCKIIEIGEVEKTTYIAMEFIDGVTLGELLSIRHTKDLSSKFKKSSIENFEIGKLVRQVKEALADPEYSPPTKKRIYALPVDSCVDFSVKCCQAIEYAHEHGILHRDLKPANIMVREDGDPVIMDFGLAKISEHSDHEQIEASMSLSVSGEIVGSIEYMSPEQAEASKFVDVRADVYSLGAILYQTLTGKKYFESSGNLLSDISQLEEYEGVRAKDAAKHISSDLDVISYKSLRPNPNERYQNIKSFRLDLQRYSIGENISARDITTYEVISKLLQRYKGIVATGVIALAMMIVGSLLFVINLNNQRDKALQNLQKAQQEEQQRIETEKQNAPVWFLAAQESAKKGDMEEGLSHIDKAIKLSQGNILYQKVKGEMLLNMERYSEAHQFILPLIVDYPRDREIRILERIAKKLLFDPDRELEHYQFLEHLTKVNRPYLAIRHDSDITFEAFKQAITEAYPEHKLENRIKKTSVKGRYNLELSNVKITDLSPLKGWKIATLVLDNIGLSNYNILSDLDFTGIVIDDPQLQNIDFLKGKQLEVAWLDDCQKLTDISVLEGMPIKHLSVNRGIRDLSIIKDMPLERFYINDSTLNNFSLKLLADTPIKDITIYSPKDFDFKHLANKSINAIKISASSKSDPKLTHIDSLESCRSLRFSNYDFKDLNFLKYLKTDELHLTSCQVNDYSMLDQLTFDRLGIQNCNIDNLDFLRNQNKLNHFSFYHPELKDITPLHGKSIQTLVLNNTNLRDLSFIKEIHGLKEINFNPLLIKSPNWIEQFQSFPEIVYSYKNSNSLRSYPQKTFFNYYFSGAFGEIPHQIIKKQELKKELLERIQTHNPKFHLQNAVNLTMTDGNVAEIEIQSPNRKIVNLQSLEFLEHYPNLKGLNITNCTAIIDFTPLSSLKNLSELILTGCTNFRQGDLLKDLPLKVLGIDGIASFNLNIIEHITTLEILSCHGIHDISTLKSESLKILHYRSDLVSKGHGQIGNLKNIEEIHDDIIEQYTDPNDYWPALIYHYTLLGQIKEENPNITFFGFKFEGYDTLNIQGRPNIYSYNFLKKNPKIRKIFIGKTNQRPDFSPLHNRDWEEVVINNDSLTAMDLQHIVTKKTTHLDIDHSNVRHLNFLGDKFIHHLQINHTPVSTINPLRNMSTLTHLGIQGTNIDDLTPLRNIELEKVVFTPAQMTTKSLHLLRHKLSLTDISTNRNTPPLTPEQFWSNYINEEYGEPLTDFVKQEQQIRTFLNDVIASNPFAMKGFVHFEPPNYLDISGNEHITNLEFLKKYPKIDSIRMKDMSPDLKDFSPLFDRPSIVSLFVEKTNFSNKELNQLSRFNELKTLSVSGSKVTNLFPIRHLKLNRLWLRDLKVKDLSYLKDMTSLISLKLNNTLVKNLGFLQNLKLEQLGFTPNQYSSDHFRTVFRNRSIQDIFVDGNNVSIEVFLGNYFDGAYGHFHNELKEEVGLLIKLFFLIESKNPQFKDSDNLQNVSYEVKRKTITKLEFGHQDFEHEKLENLDFLSEFPDLEQLDLSNCNQIKDFTPIQKLKSLKRIILNNCNQINDLAFLKGLPITTLSLKGLPETDLNDIVHLKSLKRLSIPSHTDFSHLDGLQLEFININTNHKDLEKLNIIKSMTSLTHIEDENFPNITKPEFFWGAHQAKEKLYRELIKANPDIVFSSQFKISNLELSLSRCENVNDISFLNKFKYLRSLNLSHTNIKDFSVLKNLNMLTYLFVVQTAFNNEDLASISNLEKLVTLNISLTKVNDISPLKNFSLEKLQIDRLNINDLNPISHMRDLKYLSIESISLKSIQALSYLRNLETLTFSPNIFHPHQILKIHSFRNIKSFGINDFSVLPASQFWEKYYNLEYGEVDESLIEQRNLELELLFNIQQDNPNFSPGPRFRYTFNKGKLVELTLGSYRTSDPPTLTLKNIFFLNKYEDLTSLRIDNCPNIKNFDVIKRLKKLRTLSLSQSHQFKDLSLLKDIYLTKLYLSGLKGLDFSPLKSKKIEYISFESIHNNNIDALKSIKNLHTIQDSTLPKTKHVKKYWEFFDYYSALKKEILLYNPDISLERLIIELNFSGYIDELSYNTSRSGSQGLDNNLKSLKFLEKFNDIRNFSIISNEAITDFTPLQHLKNTKHITLNNTHFSDLNFINHLNLSSLYLNGTSVSDLTPIKDMKLETLSLASQKLITTVEPLENMMSLTDLYIPYCSGILDVSPLKNLKLVRFSFNPRVVKEGLEDIKQMSSIRLLAMDSTTFHPARAFWKIVNL